MLNEEVEREIKNGKFHIYTMTCIEDAIEVLMGNADMNLPKVMLEINKELKKYNNKEISPL